MLDPPDNLLCSAVAPVQDCPARERIWASSTAVLPVDGAEVTAASKCVAQDMAGGDGSTAYDDDAASSSTFDGRFFDISASSIESLTSSDGELATQHTLVKVRPLEYNEPPRRSRPVPYSCC